MRIGSVLLAAGMSRRFGEANKLLADVRGCPMVGRVMGALLALGMERNAAVVSDAQVAQLARERGLEVIENKEPELGMARSIVLGVDAMREMDAVLLLNADQPRISATSLRRLVDAFECGGGKPTCLMDGTHFGNPAIFGKAYYDELLGLSGDRGAKSILKRHEPQLLKVPCAHEGELADADDPDALKAIAARM